MSLSIWQEHLKAYYEQERLEAFQKTRQLPRPKTTNVTIVLYVLLWMIISVGITAAFVCYLPFSAVVNGIMIAVFHICMAEFYGRVLAIKCVECYQHYASEETRRKCKCVPSCSEYAILCLKKYELIYALLKIRKRLFITCKGFDYIIDNP